MGVVVLQLGEMPHQGGVLVLVSSASGHQMLQLDDLEILVYICLYMTYL